MKDLLTAFWNCGDDQIIQFAILRAHLNRKEKEVIRLMLDECMTQEQAAEVMDCSVRTLQAYWQNASNKLLHIPWVIAYAREIKEPRT